MTYSIWTWTVFGITLLLLLLNNQPQYSQEDLYFSFGIHQLSWLKRLFYLF